MRKTNIRITTMLFAAMMTFGTMALPPVNVHAESGNIAYGQLPTH